LGKCGGTDEQCAANLYSASVPGLTDNYHQQILSSTKVNKSAAVPGRRNANSTPAQSPGRYQQFWSDTLKT